MTRARPLAALALFAALAGCGKKKETPQVVQLRGPAAVAAFRGIVYGASGLGLYLAVANEGRDDISILSAADDTPVLAPVSLRTLVVPVAQRPAIIVSASLGDGEDKADLLVAIAAGRSSLQLVDTWTGASAVVEETPVGTGSEDNVLAAVAVPTGTPGTARIAVALSGRRVAVIDYARNAPAINAVGSTVSAPLAFQPIALASIPGDASGPGDLFQVWAHVWAASLEEITPGVLGVADIDVAGTPPAFTVRALDARGPTRLVAAARLRERVLGSTAQNGDAFKGQSPVPRVYAVLDESGCGTSERIDCGVAVLNPAVDALDPSSGRLLLDVSGRDAGHPQGRMPYLAPIRLPSRPVAIAVSPAPAQPASADYTGDLMRLWPATGELASTAVAAVPCENGRIYFLDLSRWKVANGVNPLSLVGGSATSTSMDVSSPAGVRLGTIRLWVADGTGVALPADATADAVKAEITVTPGYTPSEVFTVGYQADLPSLTGRLAEVGSDAGGPWLAMQASSTVQPVRLWDPGFGVQVGDIVAIVATPAIPGCVGTEAPGAAPGTTKIFEARVDALLQPTAAYPGGAVHLAKETTAPVPDPGEAVALWGTCFDALAAAASGTGVTGLIASIRAGGYLVWSDLSGHLGRPSPGAAGFTLEYPSAGDEDSLSCPLIPWPSTLAGMACDAACRSGCEALLLARKSRRSYHLAEPCPAGDTTCATRWAGLTSPDVAGPVVAFRFALQATGTGVPVEPRRGLALHIVTLGGVAPFVANDATGQGALVEARGVSSFDRSTIDPSKGYRFFVPYAGDFVIDSSPSIAGGDPVSIH